MASYKFTLRTPDNAIVFGAESVRNWKDIKPKITENETYKALFRQFTTVFEFVGFPRQFIIETLDKSGYDAELFMLIEVGNDNKERWSFKPLTDELRAVLDEPEIDELSISVNFADSKFTANVMDNDDKKVNIDIAEGFQGNVLPALQLERARLHDRTLIFNSKLEVESKTQIIKDSPSQVYTDYNIPAFIKYASDDNFKNAIGGRFPMVTGQELIGAFYLSSDKDRLIDLSIKFDLKYKCSSSSAIWVLSLRHNDKDNIQKRIVHFAKSEGISGGTYPKVSTTENTVSVDYSEITEIKEGDSLVLTFTYKTDSIPAQDFTFTTENLIIEGTSKEYFDATECDVVLPHELIERLLSIYAGSGSHFYSNFFGRAELGYASDGPGAYLAIANGKMIRGFPFNECQLNTSLKEAFQALDAIYCLGATIEKINNKEVFRIEPYKDLLNSQVVVRLGELITEPTRTPSSKMLISEISVGYKDLQLEDINGLYSSHGQFDFVTPLQIEGQKLDIICKWVTNDIAIELTRRQQYSLNPSKDYRLDKEIFLIDCKKVGDLLIPITNEGFEIIEGIYEPDKAYNLNLSPKRNLLRWGWYIGGCLLQKQSSKIKFVKGADNPNLITKKVGEAEIIESSDIDISGLDNPEFIADKINISEAVFTREQWDELLANQTGLVEFENKGVKIYGRVSDAEFDINRKTVTFELNRANY